MSDEQDDAGDPKEDRVREARARFDEAMEIERQNRDEAADDLAFSAGGDYQWPDSIRAQRQRNKRPCLTFNRTGQFVRQVTGDIRKSPPSIRVSPVDDGGDLKLAEVLTGGIRHVEQSSRAQQAYIHAADGAARCGQGHFRLTTDYCRPDSFDLEPRIKRIKNHLSVVWDPYAQEADKSDARFCFVYERMPIAAFKRKWPKAAASSWDVTPPARGKAGVSMEWFDGKSVTVGEYWYVEERTRTLLLMPDGSTVFADELDGDALKQAKAAALREREVVDKTIHCVMLNATEELEKPTKWVGRRIPIFTVAGEEIELDARTVRRGLIRDIKDPQRMYNYMRSTGVEVVALQPKTPFQATKKQIAGYEADYKKAQHDNVPYLLFNPDEKNPGPPQRVQPPVGSVGAISEANTAVEDMYGATGIYPTSLGQKSNETSGRAIMARQQEGETGSYVYVDNLNVAVEACGRELVFIMPKIYDTERVMRVIGEDGSEAWAQLNQPTRNPDGSPGYRTIIKAKKKGEADEYLPTLDAGEYDVVVSTGPTFATKRQEASASMVEFARAVPQVAAAAADLIVKNMDWPGADEMAARLRKQLGIQEDGEAEPAPPPPPDPGAMAKAAKDAASAEKTAAETTGVQLDNMAKQVGLAQQVAQIASTMQAMQALLQQMAGGAPALPAGQMTGAPPGMFAAD